MRGSYVGMSKVRVATFQMVANHPHRRSLVLLGASGPDEMSRLIHLDRVSEDLSVIFMFVCGTSGCLRS